MSCTFGILREYDLRRRPPAPERMPRLAETMMSNPHLPTEILDRIIDHLHDTEDTLRNCSLVRLESSLKFRGREEVVAGQDQGGDASELRLGLMSSVWRKGCIPAISGRESRTCAPNMVNFPHQPRSYLDHSLWVLK